MREVREVGISKRASLPYVRYLPNTRARLFGIRYLSTYLSYVRLSSSSASLWASLFLFLILFLILFLMG